MKLVLPKRSDGKPAETITDDCQQITIIGANGAGKSRFTAKLISTLNQHRVFRISPLQAFFVSDKPDKLPHSIDSQYSKTIENSPFLRDNARTQFDKMIEVLFHEEMQNLLNYKMKSLGKPPDQPLPPTRLDKLLTTWQEIFPDNKVLHRQGQLIFSRRKNSDEYSSAKLSQGEKAVMFYIGAAIIAPEKATIFVDNPSEFLHPSIEHVVWDTIESLRPDCTFVYTTHNLDFSSSLTDSTTIWVRSYNSEEETWNYAVLPPNSKLSDEAYISILGERKPVLFIEGDATHSIDSKLYPLIFRRFAVKPLGSCDKVIESVRSFNDLKDFHNTDAYGIVDRDRRTDEEVESLRKRKIFVADVAEIENILMLEDVIKAVARFNGRNPNNAFESVKNNIVSLFKSEMKAQVIEHTRHRVKRITQTIIDHKADDISEIEKYLAELPRKIEASAIYQRYYDAFSYYARKEEYASILKVFNYKQMIYKSNVSAFTERKMRKHEGSRNRYINNIIRILKTNDENAHIIRDAIERCFKIAHINKE